MTHPMKAIASPRISTHVRLRGIEGDAQAALDLIDKFWSEQNAEHLQYAKARLRTILRFARGALAEEDKGNAG